MLEELEIADGDGEEATSGLTGPAAKTAEGRRLADAGNIRFGPEEAGPWFQWGPYLAERAWGTVREDYSPDGSAWTYFPYDHAVSRTYRWSEDGLAGICDLWQDMCFAIGLWNGRDPHLKERLFGLSGPEGNHGEDVKEYYWYRDALPSHAWLRWRYHYPQAEFPYEELRTVNAQRDRSEPEYELMDTGVFEDDKYWTVDVDYAKDTPDDIYIRITVTNNGPDTETLHVLPTIWFRNTWDFGRRHRRPDLRRVHRDQDYETILAEHWRAGTYHLDGANTTDGTQAQTLFCENESNNKLIYGEDEPNLTDYPKDGINDHVVAGKDTVNPEHNGTKAALWYELELAPGESQELRLRLWSPMEGAQTDAAWAGSRFDDLMALRESEADDFYEAIAPAERTDAEKSVMRQAFAGMIWGKQFYRYDVKAWLDGDENDGSIPEGHRHVRNTSWRHLDAYDVLSMPDAWEYPWFAAWDSAFHTVVYAHVDPDFAKYQLGLFLREWYMHPNGAIPAYEWSFDDRNPPVHAWAALRVFEIDGSRDFEFLGSVFQKLLLNFTWWVNRVDSEGNNVFEGGFLGLDNIGPIDRTNVPAGCRIEQADGTSWMAFYCLTMLRMAMRLSQYDPAYRPMMLKFLEHFAGITDGMNNADMWDAVDGFFYDQLVKPDGTQVPLRVKSVVGVIPVFAAAYVQTHGNSDYDQNSARIERRVSQFLRRRGLNADETDRAGFIYRRDVKDGTLMLLTVVDPDRLRRVLTEVLDENSFLSPYGIRSLSRRHLEEPFSVEVDGQEFRIDYEPAESSTKMYGGNSNWRGPVWFPINHLVIEALERYHLYLGEDFVVECPTGSGTLMNLQQVADELRRRLTNLFLPDENGQIPSYGDVDKFTGDPRWNSLVNFFEYFNGDNGAGLGASHQTGWTGLIADLIIGRKG